MFGESTFRYFPWVFLKSLFQYWSLHYHVQIKLDSGLRVWQYPLCVRSAPLLPCIHWRHLPPRQPFPCLRLVAKKEYHDVILLYMMCIWFLNFLEIFWTFLDMPRSTTVYFSHVYLLGAHFDTGFAQHLVSDWMIRLVVSRQASISAWTWQARVWFRPGRAASVLLYISLPWLCNNNHMQNKIWNIAMYST